MFVAAAGNSNADLGDFFPAADPDVIAVGAFAHDDTRAYFSNFGPGLDVVAPGGGDGPPPNFEPFRNVLSLLSGALNPANAYPSALTLQQGGAGYLREAGTSMAAPHVAGAAALVLAAQPLLSVEQVRQVLRTTADDVAPAGFDDDAGFGVVDVAAAVVASPPLAAQVSAPAGVVVGAVDLEVRGTASGPGFTSYTLEYRPLADPNGWVTIAGPIATPVDDGLLGLWDVSGLADESYVVRVRAERPGASFVDDSVVTVRNVVIDSPEHLAAIRGTGTLDIRGTAAGGGFVSYLVEYRRIAADAVWKTTGLTPAAPPGTPVRNGVLATLDIDSLGLVAGDRFDFRLTVENGSGTHAVTRSGTVIDPTLRAGWPQSVGSVPYRDYMIVADLDDDGIQEIFAGSADEVVVFEPDGSVRPGWPQSVATATNPLVVTRGSPLVADVTGDGKPEVIATNTQEIFVWSGDGTLQPGFPVTLGICRSGNQWLRAGDLDGDGKDEIICTGPRGAQAFHGDGSAVAGWSLAPATIFEPSRPPAVADVLGDQRVELAWYHARPGKTVSALTRGVIGLFLPDATPFVAKPKNIRGSVYTHPAMADMDGDGRLDQVVFSEHWSKRTKPTISALDVFGKKITIRRPKGLKRMRSCNGSASFADVDRDGYAEAYVYQDADPGENFVDAPGYYLPFQSKTLPPKTPLEHELFVYINAGGPKAGIAIGDIDGDGLQELVGGASGYGCGVGDCDRYNFHMTRLAVPAQRLDGSLVPTFPKPIPDLDIGDGDIPSYIYVTSFLDDPRHATPAIADLDGDGLKEVVWFDPDYGRIFVWNVAGTPGPLLADWPMYHHDPKQSNVLPPTRP